MTLLPRVLIAGCLALLALPAVAAAALPPLGGLSPSRCIDVSGGPKLCGKEVNGLGAVDGVVATRDGAGVFTISSGQDTVTAFERETDGSLEFIACYTRPGGVAGCDPVPGLDRPTAIAAPRDGKNLYVTATDSDALILLERNRASNKLLDRGCVGIPGSPTNCALEVSGLDAPRAVTVSHDDKTVIVGSTGSDAVVAMSRDQDGTGTITDAACISQTGAGGCTTAGVALADPIGLVTTPDGKNIYVASGANDAVATLTRGSGLNLSYSGCIEQSGALTPIGCGRTAFGLDGLAAIAQAPNGASIYAGGGVGTGTVAVLSRQPAGDLVSLGCVAPAGGAPACRRTSAGLARPVRGLTVSDDGKQLYAAAIDAVATFTRSPIDGGLGYQGCVGAPGGGVSCASYATGLNSVRAVDPTAEGRSAYAAAPGASALVTLKRQVAPVCFGAKRTVVHEGVITLPLSCNDMNLDPITRSVVDGPLNGRLGAFDAKKGTLVYGADPGFSGKDRITFHATDGGAGSNMATVTIEVGRDNIGPRMKFGSAKPVLVGKLYKVSLFCSKLEIIPCAGLLRSRSDKPVDGKTLQLGSIRFKVDPGKTAQIELKAPGATAAKIRKLKGLAIRVSASARDSADNLGTATRTLQLGLPGKKPAKPPVKPAKKKSKARRAAK